MILRKMPHGDYWLTGSKIVMGRGVVMYNTSKVVKIKVFTLLITFLRHSVYCRVPLMHVFKNTL